MFIDSKWVFSDYINLYTDVVSMQGFVAVFGSRWFNGRFPHIWQSQHVAVIELYPVMAALESWDYFMSNHSALGLTDNLTMVEVIYKQSTKMYNSRMSLFLLLVLL